MELILLLQYVLSLAAVIAAVLGLSACKQALLKYSKNFQKPPSHT